MKSNIVAIHYGHNATVAHLENGEVKTCISEERFNRLKNSTGWPEQALKYTLGRVEGEVDYYVLSQRLYWGYKFLKKHGFKSIRFSERSSGAVEDMPWKLKLFPKLYYQHSVNVMKNSIKEAEESKDWIEEMEDYFEHELGEPKEKILYADHHLCHTLSTHFFNDRPQEPILVFTLDGEGDGLCATVAKVTDKQVEILSRVNKAHSLGYLYREITRFMGMKPDEHEFKVMGMAPYAKEEYSAKLLPVFEKILRLNDKDEFEADIPMPLIKYYIHDNLSYQRFDNIAGAIQLFTENICLDWVERWVKRTGIKRLGVAGGVFMNVKMNQRIAELEQVESMVVVPSAGDETTVLGAAYYGYARACKDKEAEKDLKPIKHLYLGTSYTESDIGKYMKDNGYFEKYTVTKPDDLNQKIAQLAAANNVVARFSGRMEFGARALGHRTIISNPKSYENIRIINEMIKNRDFWMPFAASILEEDAHLYIKNPKKIDAPYMAITFDTTPLAHEHLLAALHPYDKTSRPQIVKKSTSPEYHALITEFKKQTGIGGILNTSFNLHGEPNVEGPKDAFHTFDNSGLNYLAIGPYLVKKQS